MVRWSFVKFPYALRSLTHVLSFRLCLYIAQCFCKRNLNKCFDCSSASRLTLKAANGKRNPDAEEFEENPEVRKGMKICFDKNSPFSACPNIAKGIFINKAMANNFVSNA